MMDFRKKHKMKKELKEETDKRIRKENKKKFKLYRHKANKNNNISSILSDAKRRNEDIKSHNPIDMQKIETKIEKTSKETLNDEKLSPSRELTTSERMKLLRKKVGNKKSKPKKPEEIEITPITKKTTGIAKIIAMRKQKQQGDKE